MQISIRLHFRRLFCAVSIVATYPTLYGADTVPVTRLPPIKSQAAIRRLPESPNKTRVAKDPYPSRRDQGPVAVDLSAYLPKFEDTEISQVPTDSYPSHTESTIDFAISPTLDRSSEAESVSIAKLPSREPAQSLKRTDALDLIPSPLTHSWTDTNCLLPAAAEQAAHLVKRASSKASRGAIYSARHELEASLATISQALDSHYATSAFSQCLRDGLVAMEEAEDFSPAGSTERISLDIALLVQRHRSHVVAPDEVANLSAIEAARKYYAYAQEHLVAAAGGSPVAAHALFGMGKLYMGMSQSDSDAERVFGPRAMMMHQTALLIDGSHSLAANELGVLLARFGRLREAREVFQHGLAVSALPATWRNLADVHDRLGEVRLAQQARAEWQRATQLAQNQNPNSYTAPNGLNVYWVDKATFERGSGNGVPHPQSVGPQAPQPFVATRPTRGGQW